jgi:DNA-binding MarR family transcriptional regulator
LARSRQRREFVGDIAGSGIRRLSTAAVLFHHALAERLGLGPTDLKCYDLLRERGAMTGSDLAALTGLTTGAITGVVARLERAGFVRRAAHPADGRKQILSPVTNRAHDSHALFRRLHDELAAVLDQYDVQQLSTVADFLSRTTALLHREIAQLRSEPIAHQPATPPRSVRRA